MKTIPICQYKRKSLCSSDTALAATSGRRNRREPPRQLAKQGPPFFDRVHGIVSKHLPLLPGLLHALIVLPHLLLFVRQQPGSNTFSFADSRAILSPACSICDFRTMLHTCVLLFLVSRSPLSSLASSSSSIVKLIPQSSPKGEVNVA